jgi:FtsH-binding integral membrane protein
MESYMRPVEKTIKRSVDVGLTNYMLKIYQYMALGLGLTATVVFFISMLPPEMQATVHAFSMLSILGTLGIVFYFSFAGMRISQTTAQGLFWLYSALMGISLSVTLSLYNAHSISLVFFTTSATFAVTSLYGHVTQKDLTSVGSFCMMGLWGIVIASLVNMFFGNESFSFAISVIGVVVFTGLLAYDTQRLRDLYYQMPADDAVRNKIAIFGALTLYLDVINLFISLLRLLGDRK